MNKYERLARAVVTKALKGDVKAAALVFRMSGEELQDFLAITPPQSTIEISYTE